MYHLPTLYKRNADGSINEWTVVIDGAQYFTQYGRMGGRLIVSDPIIAKPKNVGKINETTAEKQAELEAKSAWELKQKSENYTTDVYGTDALAYQPPMLAKAYDHVWTPSIKFIQPKLDGIRCNMSYDGSRSTGVKAISRRNNLFYSTEHIERALADKLKMFPTIHLDGELYNHELCEDFNKIVSLVKKQKPTQKDLDEITRLVRYNIYDLWDDEAPDMSFEMRYTMAERIFGDLPFVDIVSTHGLCSSDDADRHYSEFIADGYEGAILRTNDPYQHRRCKNLLKYKEFMEREFVVLSIDEGRAGGKAEFARIQLPSGECKATLAFSDEACVRILQDKDLYIGKFASVRFFGYTNDGKLRFPVLKAFRNYE